MTLKKNILHYTKLNVTQRHYVLHWIANKWFKERI